MQYNIRLKTLYYIIDKTIILLYTIIIIVIIIIINNKHLLRSKPISVSFREKRKKKKNIKVS